ncbi:MAG: phage head-tail adapter protein [Oscillospiraceae bacterium]|nr:phage head-tail adapter protein [Oscillospiraceae bacterium]
MNEKWSDMNKLMQQQIKKRDTFGQGMETLLELRCDLMETMLSFKKGLSPRDFSAIPFINAKGYHNKTIAYSLWHIFRIEDIVAHTLINNDEQVFFSGGYRDITGSPIITTGNELVREQISVFSDKLSVDGLYSYITDVADSTKRILSGFSFDDMKRRFGDEDKERIKALGVVSEDENAIWLIDYWCGKDIAGLVKMPFSRHWIMHTEASVRIAEKLSALREHEKCWSR